MSKHTEGKLSVGYGPGGITGPTVPAISGATVGECVAYREWEKGGCKGDSPAVGREIVTVPDEVGNASSVVAIFPRRGKGEAAANARLFAAAPDMRRALKMLTDATIKLAPYPPEAAEAVVAMVDIASEALAKAEPAK